MSTITMNIFYNAHHSPVGAHASFTLGCPGARGGFGLELGKPADQDVYIGLQTADGEHFEALPFFSGSEDETSRYVVGQAREHTTAARLVPFSRDAITRTFTPTIDAWAAGDLTFRILSPHWALVDPNVVDNDQMRLMSAPAIICEMTVDNTGGDRERQAVFGFTAERGATAMREWDVKGLSGIGVGQEVAVVTDHSGVASAQMFTIEQILSQADRSRTHHGLGRCGALLFNAPPGAVTAVRFAVCFFRHPPATAGLDADYWYSHMFEDIVDVARFVLGRFDDYVEEASRQTREWHDSRLSETQKWMLAHAIRSYYGSTEWLAYDGEFWWVVNEGEYRMMNTLDLTADMVFFEMERNPWTVREVLIEYADRYCYADHVRFPDEQKLYPGGVSFTHDMGVANNFAPRGHSSYELPGLSGCFSYMTHEQLVNWVCVAGVYIHETKDECFRDSFLELLEDCLTSMVNRDHPDPEQRDGVMSLDSDRCAGGAEITTYDSLDASLGQARHSTYLATKCWAAYLLLEKILREGARPEAADTAAEQARRCAETVCQHVRADGSIPALLEEGCEAVIIPIIEGLVFPYYGGRRDALDFDGPFGRFLAALKRHVEAILRPGVCLFEDGGWKLSSTSDNSWLSKTYLCQFVARKILGIELGESGARADEAHLSWLTREENAYWAWSDQCHAGIMKGSKYYPRGVTARLWLDE